MDIDNTKSAEKYLKLIGLNEFSTRFHSRGGIVFYIGGCGNKMKSANYVGNYVPSHRVLSYFLGVPKTEEELKNIVRLAQHNIVVVEVVGVYLETAIDIVLRECNSDIFQEMSKGIDVVMAVGGLDERFFPEKLDGIASDVSADQTSDDLMTKLKRYDLHQHHPCGKERYGMMSLHEEGEYVAFEDVEHILKKLNSRIVHLQDVVQAMETQITTNDQRDSAVLQQAKAVEDEVKAVTNSLNLHRNALKRARTYVEMIVTDQHCTTGTEDEDLELIDLVLKNSN